MHITQIVGEGLDNLFVVVHHDSWGLDDPEAIAHWNGKEWAWCCIFNEPSRARWTRSMLFNEGCPILLDVEGKITVCSLTGEIQVQAPPNFARTAPAGRFPKPPSFLDFVFLDADSLGVVGDDGLFYVLQNASWRYVETGTSQNITKIIGKPPYCYLCGDQTLIQFDGTGCTMLEPDLPLHLDDMDLAPDGALFMTSVSQARRCYLCCWKKSTFLMSEMPSHASYLRVCSSNEVYCGTSNGVLRWDGATFHQSLDCYPSARGTIDNHIFFGSGLQDSLIYYDPPNWKRLKIDLDETPILPA